MCRNAQVLHRGNLSALYFFAPRDQSVVITMSAAHDIMRKFDGLLATGFGGLAFCASFCRSTREAPDVDLALKLDVLAVCAVFAFVGAILLGAF